MLLLTAQSPLTATADFGPGGQVEARVSRSGTTLHYWARSTPGPHGGNHAHLYVEVRSPSGATLWSESFPCGVGLDGPPRTIEGQRTVPQGDLYLEIHNL